MSTPARARLAVAAAVVACGLLLAGCASGPEAQPSSSSSASSAAAAVLADHDLAGLEAPEVIERLDTMALADRPGDLMASVQPDAVVVTDGQGRTVDFRNTVIIMTSNVVIEGDDSDVRQALASQLLFQWWASSLS